MADYYKHEIHQLSQHTWDRLLTLAPPDFSLDQFVNLLIDYASGRTCMHDDRCIAMRLPVDPKGFLDVPATMEQVSAIQRGKPTDRLYRICTKCNRVERLNR